MFKRRVLFTLFSLFAAFCFLGCSRGPQPQILFQSLSPSGEVPLLVGEQVNFVAVVRAQNVKQPASVNLLIQSAEGEVFAQSGERSIVDGQIVELSITLEVPNATSLTLFAPLYLSGGRGTDVVDMRVYKIVGVKK